MLIQTLQYIITFFDSFFVYIIPNFKDREDGIAVFIAPVWIYTI